MANIPLKTIKFPGLDDTYTVPQIDSSFTGVAGEVPDSNKVKGEISSLKEDLNIIEDAVLDTENLLNVTTWKSTSNSDVVNNNDGTFTFPTTKYGTTTWESVGEVPAGTYTLLGVPYGFTVISAGTSYSADYIEKNDTGEDKTYTNPTSQKLYLMLRLNSAPAEAFTIAPAINHKKVIVVEKNQGVANAGTALVVNDDGILEPVDLQIDEQIESAVTPVASRFIDNKITINKTISISGELNSSPNPVIGIIIPNGRPAKLTVSTDISHNGYSIGYAQTAQALFTNLVDKWSGHPWFDDATVYDISLTDVTVIALRFTLRHIASTSGTINVSIEIDGGTSLSVIDNLVANKAGANLINPVYIFEHVGLHASNGRIDRFTSNVSLAYVPIKANNKVSFNKVVNRCALVDTLFDGDFDSTTVAEDVKQVTNSTETDKYVIFHCNTSTFASLIAVEGDYEADYIAYNPIGGYIEETPDNSYGTIGRYYPDEVKNLKRMDSTQRANRLRFLHVTDTHQSGDTPLYHTDEFTDLSEAEFMTITGDLVNSTIENDFAVTASVINAMTKPCYICMGNHDVWNDTAESQRYAKYFNLIAEHNGVAQNVSYYAVDFATEKVKCIWLDQYELSTGTPANIMSATQINWLFGQLDDAITNNMHVCIFMHTALASIEKPENPFFDHTPLNSKATGIGWILDVISAFQTGSSVTFEHNGNSYSHTFSGNGVFVSYFCGHTHWDACGWYKDYNQFVAVCTRLKTTGESYDNVYRGDKLGIACNYVCIDTAQRRLSIIRIGQETTIIGVKRDAFSIEY